MTGEVNSFHDKVALLGWTWAKPPKFEGDMVAFGDLPTPPPFDHCQPRKSLCKWDVTDSRGQEWLMVHLKVLVRGRDTHRIARMKKDG